MKITKEKITDLILEELKREGLVSGWKNMQGRRKIHKQVKKADAGLAALVELYNMLNNPEIQEDIPEIAEINKLGYAAAQNMVGFLSAIKEMFSKEYRE